MEGTNHYYVCSSVDIPELATGIEFNVLKGFPTLEPALDLAEMLNTLFEVTEGDEVNITIDEAGDPEYFTIDTEFIVRSSEWVGLKLCGELTIKDEIREIQWLNEIKKLRNKSK